MVGEYFIDLLVDASLLVELTTVAEPMIRFEVQHGVMCVHFRSSAPCNLSSPCTRPSNVCQKH
jgi:hypothetical protein